MTYLINNNALILNIDYKPYRIEKTEKNYLEILNLIQSDNPDKESLIIELLQKPNLLSIQNAENKQFTFKEDGSVTYMGEKLPDVLAEKVLHMIEENHPIENFIAFWDNLRQNTSFSAISELYDFLSYKELPITEDGCFIAYKGVQEDMYSIHGNRDTKVLQGKVDANGKILNKVGETIEVDRRYVDDDRNNHCSQGLHVGSLDYAKGWGSKVVVVKINPKDVVSVPRDANCQKCRVTKYEILSSFEQEITTPSVDANGNTLNILSKKDEICDFIGDLIRNHDHTRNLYISDIHMEIEDKFNTYYGFLSLLDIVEFLGYEIVPVPDTFDENYTADYQIII